MTIAVFDKIRSFFRRFRVNNAAEFRRFAVFASPFRVIGDDSDLNSANPRRAANHFFGVIGLKFVEFAVVQNAISKLRGYHNRRDGPRAEFRKVFRARFSALAVR